MNRGTVHRVSSAFIILIGASLATIGTLIPYSAQPQNTGKQLSAAINIPTATPSSTPSATPSPTTPPATPKPAGKALGTQAVSRISSLGIAAGSSLPGLSSAALAARLDGMKALGITWLRYDIEWANIEQAGPGQYNWTDYDKVTTAAAARGFKIIGIIDYSPPWARLASCPDTSACAPADPTAYAAFAGAAANHYKGLGIHTWEIWNEPNNKHYFQPAADTARYTQMLRLAYAQIKAADPGAFVLTGGLSPADTENGYISPPDFLNGIYQQGGRGYFDAVGHHPYSYPFLPSRTNPDSAWGQLTILHNIMAANSDPKKIWVTEFGAPTGGPGSGPVTEATEAQILNDAIAQIKNKPWVGPFLWYSYQDAGTSQSTVENFFGLLRADGSPKPVYQVFRNLIQTY